MLIDTHAHLFFDEYRDDLDGVIARAEEAGVGAIVIPGTDLATSREAVALADRYPRLYAAVGVHPHEAAKASSDTFAALEQLSMHPRVVAIGEIGLDYHYDFSPPDVQHAVFSEQIGLAIRRNLPVIIHTREAEADTLSIVTGMTDAAPDWKSAKDGGRPLRGVFHCFPGDETMARRVISAGFLISFPGPVTFPARPGRPNSMHDVVTAIPLEHILLETDSPYLTPVPHRGKRNEPSYLPLIAQTVAERKQIPFGEVERCTTATACALFGFPPPEKAGGR